MNQKYQQKVIQSFNQAQQKAQEALKNADFPQMQQIHKDLQQIQQQLNQCGTNSQQIQQTKQQLQQTQQQITQVLQQFQLGSQATDYEIAQLQLAVEEAADK